MGEQERWVTVPVHSFSFEKSAAPYAPVGSCQELDLLTKIKYGPKNYILSPYFIHMYCGKDGLNHPLEI